MEKKLNSDKVNQAMQIAGLTQTAVAEHLDVSKEAVSQWLSHKAFPRPNKLLQLGKLLSLSFDEIVIKEDPYAPANSSAKSSASSHFNEGDKQCPNSCAIQNLKS